MWYRPTGVHQVNPKILQIYDTKKFFAYIALPFDMFFLLLDGLTFMIQLQFDLDKMKVDQFIYFRSVVPFD